MMRLCLHHVVLLLLHQTYVVYGSKHDSLVGVQATVRTEGYFRDNCHVQNWKCSRKRLNSIGTERSTKFLRHISTATGLRGGGQKRGGQLPSKPISLTGMVKATRPWTLTAGVVPVLLIAALIYKADHVKIEGAGVLNALMMVTTLQSSVNLYNSYDDYMNGVDTVETSGDRTIVDDYVSPSLAIGLAGVLLVLGCLAVVPTIVGLRAIGAARELEITFWLGVFMSFSYTCWPLRLKYRGLGDIGVYLGFGPMLAQVASVLMTGKAQHWVIPYGIPASLLCEAILHANNMRDIDNDRSAGICTLAMMMGFRRSQLFYRVLIVSAYVAACGLAIVRCRGCALPLLSLPLALSALRDCRPQTVRSLDEATAKVHLVFGVLMIAGLLLSP